MAPAHTVNLGGGLIDVADVGSTSRYLQLTFIAESWPRWVRSPSGGGADRMRNSLRELRAVRRWSQADLADVLGVSRQTVNAIETERFDASLPLAFKIAQVFDQPIEAIFDPQPDTDDQP